MFVKGNLGVFLILLYKQCREFLATGEVSVLLKNEGKTKRLLASKDRKQYSSRFAFIF